MRGILSMALKLTLMIAVLTGPLILSASGVAQQPAFAVATIRPSSAEVKFERDGKTETRPGTLQMHDVTVHTCIKWAYGVQDNQISGPAWLESDHFDILAKADSSATEDQMKIMLQTLLADRFQITFHHQNKELKSFVLAVAKGGPKLSPAAAPDAKPYRQNSANGTIARSMTIREFGDFISGPLQMPVVDETGLTGKYDFTIDFTPYLPDPSKNMDAARPDATSILMAVLEGELGLKLESRKAQVDVMVIDHVQKPSDN
jgi:uncharacterized protein (TIGR03435 family)